MSHFQMFAAFPTSRKLENRKISNCLLFYPQKSEVHYYILELFFFSPSQKKRQDLMRFFSFSLIASGSRIRSWTKVLKSLPRAALLSHQPDLEQWRGLDIPCFLTAGHWPLQLPHNHHLPSLSTLSPGLALLWPLQFHFKPPHTSPFILVCYCR